MKLIHEKTRWLDEKKQPLLKQKAAHPPLGSCLCAKNSRIFREHMMTRRLYSSWQWGGYLIYRLWPSLTVFDDGRTDFYGPAFVSEGLRVWNVSPGWRKILERYGVNSVLVPADSPLAGVLREAPGWKLVYQDSVVVLFDKVEQPR